MYIEEFEKVDVVLKDYRQPVRWIKTIGYKPELNKPFKVHWSLLKTKAEYRIKFINVKCDDCGSLFERRIRDLDPNKDYHLCGKCQNKGERNGQFGKPISVNAINGVKKWMDENGNPFTWESSKKKIKEKNGWAKQNWKIGFKHSDISKEKMSLSAIKAFKEGRRAPNSGWCKIKTKQYNGLDYQGSYELRFLKYIESLGKLELIERGPRIDYIDADGKIHNYYIDYRIKGEDVVFEIKSNYIWNKNKEVNEIKMREAEKKYKYYLIMNNNFEKIKDLFI